MLYTKKIEEITYEDIVGFCDEQIRENISLDYKEEIDGSIAKTIAAMANTWGGLIIIGAEDQDSKPKLPLKGVELKEHLREQINNIILGNITPPVFPEIQICPSTDKTRALAVVRVAQSNTTPHAIRGNTRVYLRTDTSNEPEELATVDRVLWLINKREKSTELKNSFYEKAQSRLQKLTGKKVPIQHADIILAASPLYPFEAMVDYRKLRNGILDQLSTQSYGQSFPSNLHHARFEPTENGSYSLMSNAKTGYVCYEELNHYGFFYHREDIAHSEKRDDGTMINRCYPIHSLVDLDLFLQTIQKYYSILGYWGFVEVKMIMNNIGQTTFTDLPAPRGFHKLDNEVRIPIDDRLEFTREIMAGDLLNDDKRREIVKDIFAKFAWALGFPWINEGKIEELFEKGW